MSHHQQETPCECPSPGFCERHQCQKTEHFHKLCQTRLDYFALWEEEKGPGQNMPNTPGLIQKAENFGRAVVRHIANRARKVSDEVFEERLAICMTCPSCDPKKWICREKTCGCRLKVKARWASERCPLGKWESDFKQPPDTSAMSTNDA